MHESLNCTCIPQLLYSGYFDYDIHEDELKEKYNTGDKLPIFIFLDKNGNELERQIGEPSEELLLSLIDKYEEL